MKKQKKDWFRIKGYPHIGLPIKPKDILWVKKYAKTSSKVAKHSFLPFIHREIVKRKFRKEYDESGIKTNNGKGVGRNKIRDIYYANHFDANIYSYYSSLLSSSYEKRLFERNLCNTVTAYRKIPLKPSDINSRNMCNIDFANEIFEFIRKKTNQDLVAITFDITSYFDNLDHYILKKYWGKVIKKEQLPSDHYNVFKNITKFSYVEEIDLFNEFKKEIITETKTGIRTKKNIKNISLLKKKRAIAYCEKKMFKTRIVNNGYLKSNKYNNKKELRKKGIPQGSPISAVLANLYLLDFDTKINDYLSKNDGIYRRYSDDMVVVCNINMKNKIISLFHKQIEKYKLDIQPKKTQVFHFIKNKEKHICYNETQNGTLLQTKRFEYLGFEFDGEFTYLKSSSLAGYYRKMKKGINRSTFFAKHTKDKTSKNELFIKRLYKKYSYIGANRRRIFKKDIHNPGKWIETHKYDWGNYITYAKLAENSMNKNKIGGQIKNHWKILNELIKKKQKELEPKE